MDILFAAGRARVKEIQRRLPDAPSYSTVRTILKVLEWKGFVKHTEESLRKSTNPSPRGAPLKIPRCVASCTRFSAAPLNKR